jgi:hypothetical protein
MVGGCYSRLHFPASKAGSAVISCDWLQYGAARLSGVNTTRMIYIAYILSALRLRHLLAFAHPGQRHPGGAGNEAIASSVIGGTSLSGPSVGARSIARFLYPDDN